MRILWRLWAFLLPFCDYLKMSQVALEYSGYIVCGMFCIVTKAILLEVPQIFETPGDTLYMYLRYVLYDMSINSNDDIW